MLKFIAWIIFFYLLFRLLRNLIGPLLGMPPRQQRTFTGGFYRQTQNPNVQDQQQQQYRQGKTYVKSKPENYKSTSADDDGEYIDYKEIKD